MIPAADWPGLDDEALLIAVANTGHREDDEFADPRAAMAWWRELGATRAPAGHCVATSGDLEMLRALRAVIRRAALRNNGIDIDVDATALDGLVLRPDLSGNPSLRAGTTGDLAAGLWPWPLRLCCAPPRDRAGRGSRHAAAATATWSSSTVPATPPAAGATWLPAGTEPRANRSVHVTAPRRRHPDTRARLASGLSPGPGRTAPRARPPRRISATDVPGRRTASR